jgi:hypothetical protein
MFVAAVPDLDQAAIRPEDKVPVHTKVAFRAANMTGIFTNNLSKELLKPVHVVTLGLGPAQPYPDFIIQRTPSLMNPNPT